MPVLLSSLYCPTAARLSAAPTLTYLPPCSPPPPSVCLARVLHSYTTFGICGIMTYLILNGPDNSLAGWARPHAVKELEEEDAVFAAYAADKQLQQQTAQRLRAQGKDPDRWVGALTRITSSHHQLMRLN